MGVNWCVAERLARCIRLKSMLPMAAKAARHSPLRYLTALTLICGVAQRRSRDYTTDLCKPNGTYWVYDYSIGYLGGWGAHPLDIMVWGSKADTVWAGDCRRDRSACQRKGCMTVSSTGIWISNLGDVKLVFRPGSDRTKFIGQMMAGSKWLVRIAKNAASAPDIASSQTSQADRS